MARYKLTAAAIINDVYCDIGSEIEFDGIPGPHMEPLDAPAKRAVADRDKQPHPALDPDKLAHPAEDTHPGPRREAAKDEDEPDHDDDKKVPRHG